MMDATKSTSRRQGRLREEGSEGSRRQTCEPTDRNRIEGSAPGELAQHNEARRFRGQGKCGGCARKVHVLIRGDLFTMRQEDHE